MLPRRTRSRRSFDRCSSDRCSFDRGSFDQAQRKVEFRTQLFFAPCHPSIVALVIVAAQMQDAVQHENLNFLGGRVPERSRIFGC